VFANVVPAVRIDEISVEMEKTLKIGIGRTSKIEFRFLGAASLIVAIFTGEGTLPNSLLLLWLLVPASGIELPMEGALVQWQFLLELAEEFLCGH
jgi:hypothetical protein